ncbi:MAG TPA: long-chain fatty acid--CoA ligase [Jiangellaceae bacterium]|jgi:long-chain acyl-CoA synthetase|nr:long-chain fatty acid--CoA ligase [Jiangellaceae bacterium]
MTDVVTDPAEVVKDRPASVGRMFLDRARTTPTREAFRYPLDDGWQALTWQETKDRVWAVAAGLLSLGIQPEQRVAIASSTRFEWVLADLGIMCVGAATTTVYPSTPPDDVSYILSDSGSRVVFAEDQNQVDKVLEHRAELLQLTTVVVFDGSADGDLVITFADLEERGRKLLAEAPTAVDDAVASVGHDSLATLIYTSGTTGRPKGVRLTHGNWTYEAVAIEALNLLTEDDVQYLWLPLSHSLGKVLQVMQLFIGFSTAVDGRVDKIVENLAVIQPTFMGAPPRIFEKVMARVTATAEHEGGVRRKIVHWAVGVGRQMSELAEAGGAPGPSLKAQNAIADRLVFHKLRGRLGGRIRFFVSGAAALSTDVARFFHGAGMLILEGYGLTETSAFTCVNRPDNYRIGSVGLPAPGTEVKIADDGEILIKGPGVMTGYHNQPEATAEVLTDDGWFLTGDMGELLPSGHLMITDRKKDLIKTSGGKYVAPQTIEALFKAVCPYASQMVVHGHQRNYVTALVSLDHESIATWGEQHELTGSYADVVTSPQVRELVQGYVDQLNSRLARHEQIKKFEILSDDLTVEEGELTPSMKVRRNAVEKKYADTFDRMYSA